VLSSCYSFSTINIANQRLHAANQSSSYFATSLKHICHQSRKMPYSLMFIYLFTNNALLLLARLSTRHFLPSFLLWGVFWLCRISFWHITTMFVQSSSYATTTFNCCSIRHFLPQLLQITSDATIVHLWQLGGRIQHTRCLSLRPNSQHQSNEGKNVCTVNTAPV